ncbi:MAG TPA: hypothetical protein VEQ35_03560 [Beijerinckia sp.]|nr:hypothetical protein [Beijerinckia sp.]
MEEVLNAASKFQLEIVKENNRHIEATIAHDLGFFGRAFGGEKSAPTHVALIAMLFGLAGAGVSFYMAAHDGTAVEFWGKQIERSVAFASTALAFIFGRGSKN